MKIQLISYSLFFLFYRTKRFIVDIIHCQAGDDLTQILNAPTTKEQEMMHLKLLATREISDKLINSDYAENNRQSKT